MPPVNQKDVLAVDLQISNADAANAAINNFTDNLKKSTAEINTIAAASQSFGDDFSRNLASVQRQTLSLHQTLRQISQQAIGVKGLDGLGLAAQRSGKDLDRIYSRLREIQRQAGLTSDKTILGKLTAEANTLGGELDRLQNKMDRVAAGRNAAAARNAAAGGGGLGRAGSLISGASNFLPQEFQNVVQGGEAALAAGVVTAGSLAALGAIAAAGIGIVKISESIRKEAERTRDAQFAIAAAVNKQILQGQENLKNFAKARADAEEQRQFNESLQTKDIDALNKRKELLDQINKTDPTGPDAERNNAEAAAIEQRIADLRKQNVADANKAFAQGNEDFKQNQKDAAEAEKRRAEQFRENVNKGISKVVELGKATDELFDGLFAKQGENNPFVATFADAEKAIENTRLATAGLNQDLQDTAARMVRTQNAAALFNARLENRLQVSDLRAAADSFRKGGPVPTSEDFQKAFLDFSKAKAGDPNAFLQFDKLAGGGTISRDIRQTLFTAFDPLAGGGTIRRERSFSDLSDEEKRSLVNQFSQVSAADLSTQQRLDRQISVVQSLHPEDEQQRQIADRKIIALTEGIDPAALTEGERNAAAQAREAEAARAEKAETAAQEQRAAQTEVQKSIDKNIAELLGIAKKEGFTGVIRIINDAEDKAKVSLGKRPTERDTQTQMAL